MATLEAVGSIAATTTGEGALITLTIYALSGSVGVKVGGDSDIAADYLTRQVSGSGGVKVGGATEISISYSVHSLESTGGVKVGGFPGVNVTKSLTRVIEVVGGVKVGGNPTVRIALDFVKRIEATGGVKVGGPSGLVVSSKLISVVATGGVRVGGRFYPEVVITAPAALPWQSINITASGGVEISGEAEVNVFTPETISVDVTPIAVAVAGESVIVVIKPIEFAQITPVAQEDEIADDIFDTWVLTDSAQLPSIYTGFNFNSYAVYQNHGYGAGPDGIFLLEGDDDNGALINTGIRLPQTNFGIPESKRLRSVYMNNGNEDATVRVQTGDKEGTFERTRGWIVSRDLHGKEFIIDVLDFEELSQMSITPIPLHKRY